jgi:uncharacterized linocin/CFP29 family protein
MTVPSILKRENAPVSDEAWAAIDAQASQTLQDNLVARQLVDFVGPMGWDCASVNTGRLKISQPGAEVPWGQREILPLLEIRIPFTLSQFELDNLTRGAKDVDLDPVDEAALKAAKFEDNAVLNGFKDGQIRGLGDASEHKPVTLPKSAADLPGALASAVKSLSLANVLGPYHLVLEPETYFDLMSQTKGVAYPPHRILQDLLDGGSITRSPVVTGGLVCSGRGEDFELTVGKDFSVGYASHDREEVEFFLTESFTFRVIEPRAVVALKPARK